MGNVTAARRLAAAAVYGGGGLGVLGASTYGLLKAEARMARHLIGNADKPAPDATGWYGRSRPGPAIRLVLLGDSSAAGYGVARVEDTPGAHLAGGVAEEADRRVHLREFCRVGAQSGELADQVSHALPVGPDVAVILIGANDVTHGVRLSESVAQLGDAVRRLRESGAQVLVGTCPDLGTVRPIPQPLRQLARTLSRRLAAAQTIATLDAGGRTVSLGTILGPEFDAAPALFFGPDQFHPSAAGYRSLATVLVPSVLAALGFAPEEADEVPTDGVLPVAAAAVAAARNTGTEIEQTQVAGRDHSGRGRWVSLARRRRTSLTGEAAAPGRTETAPETTHPA